MNNLELHLNELVNGFTVTVYDHTEDKYIVNEFVERRVDALRLSRDFFENLFKLEVTELFKNR